MAKGVHNSDTMVLSMLSAIQCVKQISQGGPGGAGAPTTNTKLDMSRRKQRNPKPIFSPSEEDQDAADNNVEPEMRDSRSDSEGSNGETDSDNPLGDIGDMVKVEVDEEERGGGPASSPPRHNPMGGSGGVHPSVSPSGARPEMVFPSVEDIMRKCNMFQFGEVTVLNHPNTPPVPMAIPMTYLYPMSRDSVTGEAKYKMLVPFNNPEMSMAPPGMIPFPSPPLVPQLHLPSAAPQIRPEESIQKKSKQVSTPAKPQQTPNNNRSTEQKQKVKKDETGTGPLDLTQKSPNSSRSDIEEDMVKEDSILPDRHSPNIPLKLEPTNNKDDENSAFSPRIPTSPRDLPRTSTSGDLETQLNFLKVKHLEFLKASGASANVNRCNECNINFSKYQNYVAHKKYYCTGIKQQAPSDSDDDSSQSSTKLETALGGRGDRDVPAPSSASATSPLPTAPSLAQAYEAGLNKDLMNRELLLKQQELMGKEALQAVLLQQVGREGGPGIPLLLPGAGPPLQPPTSHFTCEGCGIKFKSVNNLQAHQARYCAGIRKAEEATAMEALMKRSGGGQMMPGPSAADMISFLSARQVMENQGTQETTTDKSPRTQEAPASSASSGSSPSEDFCCILCGYKESSVDRLKDHINMHFIGQIKKRKAGSDLGISASGPAQQRGEAPSPSLSPRDDIVEPEVKKIKRESETEENSPPAPTQQKPITPKVNGSNHKAETSVQSSTDTDAGDGSPRSPGEGDQHVLPVKCNNCDISFMHISTFIAHQKYYCRNAVKQE